jgi:hypothetical protein
MFEELGYQRFCELVLIQHDERVPLFRPADKILVLALFQEAVGSVSVDGVHIHWENQGYLTC